MKLSFLFSVYSSNIKDVDDKTKQLSQKKKPKGNGASELIDLVTRIAAPEGNFITRSPVQYKEYERAALADGRKHAEVNTTEKVGEKYDMTFF